MGSDSRFPSNLCRRRIRVGDDTQLLCSSMPFFQLNIKKTLFFLVLLYTYNASINIQVSSGSIYDE